MQVWFNGRTPAFQASDEGSIPFTCLYQKPPEYSGGFFCLISGGHKILCPPFSLAQIYDIVVKMGRHNITTVKKFICLTTSVIYLAADVLFLSQPVVSSAGSLEDTIAAMQ